MTTFARIDSIGKCTNGKDHDWASYRPDQVAHEEILDGNFEAVIYRICRMCSKQIVIIEAVPHNTISHDLTCKHVIESVRCLAKFIYR